MARRHWLDPLARRLLIATGQLPPPPAGSPQTVPDAATAGTAADEQVETDLLRLRLAQDPALRFRDPPEVARAAALGWRLDVNRATAADWLRLPGCSADQVDLLMRLQAGGIQLSGPEDLQQVLGLDEARLSGWRPVLEFRWYPEAATPASRTVRLNRAGATELGTLPGLSPERLRRLQRERGRGPFRDLADLQLRLRFPPEVVEQWIGRVSFEAGPAGPELPPASRQR
jgi:DNA uptake protein ComE-like DNA-binding protein